MAEVGLWRARGEHQGGAPSPAPASMDTPRGLGRASLQTLLVPGPLEGGGREKEPCLTAEPGFWELESYFIKRKSQPPGRGAGDGCRGFFVTVLKTLSD